MLEIPLNHQWSYFIYLWVIFWRSSWNILAMHSQKSETCPFILWFWCRTAPTLVTQCLLLSMVLWQEHLHQLFPSLAALPPPCHTAQTLSHLQSWAFSTQHAPPLKCSHFNLSGNFCLGPGGKSCKTQQRANFSCWPQQFLQLHHFPDAWDLVSREDASWLAFGPGTGCSAHFCNRSCPLPQAPQGVVKKTRRCVTDAWVFATVYEREADSLSLLWGLTVLGYEQDLFLVFISAQALLKTVLEQCFFSWIWDPAHILGVPHSSPIKQVGTYMNWWSQRVKIQVEWDTSLPKWEMCSPGHVNDGNFCGPSFLLLVCLPTQQTMYLLIFQPHTCWQLSFSLHLTSRF